MVPTIKVEPIVDPSEGSHQGALFAQQQPSHHQDIDGVTVTGRAEGLVAGKRVTRPLILTPNGTEGTYAVTRQ